MFKIDDDIEVPAGTRNSQGFSQTIKALKLGQSALLPIRENSLHVLANRLIGKGNYTVRQQANGYRIWRIK